MIKDLISPHIHDQIESFAPAAIWDRYPVFIEFARAYFKYLEGTNSASYYLNTLNLQRSLDTQDSEFLERIEKEMGLYVPRKYLANPRVFFNRISELYRSKGSEEAIRAFFRIFYNDSIEIIYPYDSVLIPSDGRWVVDNKIRVSIISGDPSDFVGARIQQLESYGLATVKKVERRIYADDIIYELTLNKNDVVGKFLPENRIIVPGTDLIAEIYKSVSGIKIINPGVGYRVGDRITLNNRPGFTFAAFVTGVNETGGITRISLSNYGSGNTPKHIRDARASGQYYLEDFRVFRYESGREGTFTDSLDITETVDSFKPRSTDYTYPYEFYFMESYNSLASGDLNSYNYLTSSLAPPQEQFNYSPLDPGQELDFIIQSNTINTINEQYAPFYFAQDYAEITPPKFELEYDAIVSVPGRYQNNKGQLSEAIVLQDSRYYQKFSYEIATSIPMIEWQDSLKRNVHVAGMLPFGKVQKIDYVNAFDGISDSIGFTLETGYLKIFKDTAFISDNFEVYEFLQTVKITDPVFFRDRTAFLTTKSLSSDSLYVTDQNWIDSGLVYMLEDYLSEDYINDQIQVSRFELEAGKGFRDSLIFEESDFAIRLDTIIYRSAFDLMGLSDSAVMTKNPYVSNVGGIYFAQDYVDEKYQSVEVDANIFLSDSYLMNDSNFYTTLTASMTDIDDNAIINIDTGTLEFDKNISEAPILLNDSGTIDHWIADIDTHQYSTFATGVTYRVFYETTNLVDSMVLDITSLNVMSVPLNDGSAFTEEELPVWSITKAMGDIVYGTDLYQYTKTGSDQLVDGLNGISDVFKLDVGKNFRETVTPNDSNVTVTRSREMVPDPLNLTDAGELHIQNYTDSQSFYFKSTYIGDTYAI